MSNRLHQYNPVRTSITLLDAAPNMGYTTSESVAIDPYARDEDPGADEDLYPEFEI